MPKDLPPLTALRAFEAAGRHLSITRAADELCVTAAAVSHQVKALEDYLEVRLFRRTGNSLFLTDAGQAFLPGLRAGFAALEHAMNALHEHDLRGAVVLSVAPVFASKWLIPRLEDFHAAHPEIDVRISATLELADFERDGIDAAIRLGRGRYPGLVAHRLFGESVVPMCSPALRASALSRLRRISAITSCSTSIGPHRSRSRRTGARGCGRRRRRGSMRPAGRASRSRTMPCRQPSREPAWCSDGARSPRRISMRDD